MDNADDEAPKDPGAQQANHQSYTEKDYEGHRAHTVYIGVHLPGERRHSHRRHHKHHHNKTADDKDDVDLPSTPPAQRVQFILGEDVDDGTHESHPLFSEMEELVKEGDEMEWKETARWIKFEEDVEEGGNRWSKPHVATLSLHSLFELRSLLLNGTVILDMEASSLEQIADLVLDNMVNAGSLALDAKDKVRDALLRRHRHQHERRKDNNVSRLPIIRSLAEIGRNHSSSKSLIITPIYYVPDEKHGVKKSRGRLYEQTTCPKCGKIYTTRKSMMRHYRFQCTNARQFKCSVCIYRCNRKDNLRSHMHLQHKLRLL